MFIGHTKGKYALISILTRPDAYISETISTMEAEILYTYYSKSSINAIRLLDQSNEYLGKDN